MLLFAAYFITAISLLSARISFFCPCTYDFTDTMDSVNNFSPLRPEYYCRYGQRLARCRFKSPVIFSRWLSRSCSSLTLQIHSLPRKSRNTKRLQRKQQQERKWRSLLVSKAADRSLSLRAPPAPTVTARQASYCRVPGRSNFCLFWPAGGTQGQFFLFCSLQ